ncbi:hypothetical protein [Thalassotalea montiporae]
MRTESDKAKVELNIFLGFVDKASLNVNSETIRKGCADARQPDIYCELNGSPVYFELTEACSHEFCAAITKALKTGEPQVVWGDDVSEQTIAGKLTKTYNVSDPIELVLYTAGRTALPDEVIISRIESLLKDSLGEFHRVWLYGDEVHLLAEAS